VALLLAPQRLNKLITINQEIETQRQKNSSDTKNDKLKDYKSVFVLFYFRLQISLFLK